MLLVALIIDGLLLIGDPLVLRIVDLFVVALRLEVLQVVVLVCCVAGAITTIGTVAVALELC